MEIPGFATPGNTSGMGNPTAPGETGELGSGDVIGVQQTPKDRPKKKMKPLKDYLKNKKK